MIYLKGLRFTQSWIGIVRIYVVVQGVFSAPFVLHTVLGSALGIPMNPQASGKAEKELTSSLSKLEYFWLTGKGKFLLGSFQPSIADLSLVCEIMQLEDRIQILSPFKKSVEVDRRYKNYNKSSLRGSA
ncbi:glutathione S-transferase T1-like isoform X1 [Papaver somniferum]|uniref:glutathione S-transferase T1-like isoform X1 n=1 Tax=Papaver somniferum TaxID=3469 RepID=UPI000E70022D|nr:glutathione S-transferase T1-like isoform X1 [Papaver somniferum]